MCDTPGVTTHPQHLRRHEVAQTGTAAKWRWDAATPELLASPLRRTGENESGAVRYEGLARVEGPLTYRDGAQEHVEWVTREAIEASVELLVGLPAILGVPRTKDGKLLGHPKDGRGRLMVITPRNWRQYVVGVIESASLVELDNGRAAVKVAIWVLDADAQEWIEKGGASQLSPLYDPVLVDETGTIDGITYQRKQVGVVAFNNIIFTDAGRAGETCSVRVDAEDTMPLISELDFDAFWKLLRPLMLEVVQSCMPPASEEPTGDVAVPETAQRADAMDQADLDAIAARVVAAIEAKKTDDWAKSMASDEYTKALAKAIKEINGAEPAAPAETPAGDADPAAALKAENEQLKADMAALKAKYDAMEGEKLKGDAADLDAVLKSNGVVVEGFDPEKPTTASLTAARAALGEAVAKRASRSLHADDRFHRLGPPAPPRTEGAPAEPKSGTLVSADRYGG